jgi:hypothetical protein
MRLQITTVTCALLILAAAAPAKDKKPKTPPKDPQDEIEVVGHVPLTGGAVRRFLPTQHYSSFYLYAEREAGKNVTLIDVTSAVHAAILADVAFPSNAGASLFAVAGAAALVTEDQAAPTAAAPPQTIRIMDLSDALHPKVAREFTGVTAIARDDRRGLIFLANPEGLWILHQTFAEDPEVRKAYDRYILYNR